ncbi:DUF3944 domain-containing protein [Gallibacterium trehalosifermentans]|uniref:DUF3944 domain-containing protein n=1 Tax=Gallibacterium trehalosifermentans TaxID=516935 RepID=A0ABV6H0V8_9PAST
MAYRFDKDLEFLGQLTDEELSPLVEIITKDKDGDSRLTEELTSSDVYKHYHPQHSKYWKEIAAELQLFGGNTIASLFRGGKGVLYREFLIDVANKLKVNFNPKSSVERIEQNLLIKLFEDFYEKSPNGLQALLPELDLSLPYLKTMASATLCYQVSRMILMSSIYRPYPPIYALMPPVPTANPILGPLGWAITAGWLANSLASPAYRVIIPAVIYIASLRLQRAKNINS